MIKKLLIILLLTYPQFSHSSVEVDFNIWLKKFKISAQKEKISEETINNSLKNAKYLEQVIKYDRYQPEFFEDTKTYIEKRATRSRMLKAKKLLIINEKLFDKIEKEFKVEKELLLALWGIETNFGKHVGKMDIISSLATLGFDKRRSKFFTKELITILKLIDKGAIDHKILYGSWAGAFGYFQFMPSTIERYAIDYNKNNLIELKNNQDSFASAANYLKKMGWKKNKPCFIKIDLNSNIPNKYLNTSAQQIKNRKKVKFFKKYIKNYNYDVNENLNAAIITPDAEIVDNESWAEIDDPNDFHQANFLFSNKKASLLKETFGGYWHYEIIDFCFISHTVLYISFRICGISSID